MTAFRIIGAGRAGLSVDAALCGCGWESLGVANRTAIEQRLPAVVTAAATADVVILAVPDDAIAAVAAVIEPGPAVVMHLSGAKRLDVLAPHPVVASVHPLVSLPDPVTGARRLAEGATFAVAGRPEAGRRMAERLVEALGGRPIAVAEHHRATYHAAASIGANHLVALCAQVERLAERAGVPVDVYWELMAATLDNVTEVGPAAALTGPAARGDRQTIADHLAALDPAEHHVYLALSDEAARLAGGRPPTPPSSEAGSQRPESG